MQPMKSWTPTVGLLASLTLAAAPNLPAIAAPQPSPAPATLPSGALAVAPGDCRVAGRPTPVFKEASTESDALKILDASQKVTAADTGTNGFLKISAPVEGYVQSAVLKLCGTTPAPTGKTCRLVARPDIGLRIRSKPDKTSADVGGVGVRETVDLTTDPATAQTDSEGRIWVQIAKPASGWVSNGLKTDPISNLVYCP